MSMNIHTTQKGQSLIEILFALALFTIGVVTVGYVLFDAFDSFRYGVEASQARYIAIEGIEAVRSIRDTDSDQLQEGTYGLAHIDGYWELSSSSDDLLGTFDRTLTIEKIAHETWYVSSRVTWGTDGGTLKEYVLDTVFTNWTQTQGQAGALGIDVGGVYMNASSTELGGITLYNTDQETLTITGLVFSYEGDASVSSVTLGGTEVYTSATSSVHGSGDNIESFEYALEYGAGAHSMNPVVFSAPIDGDSTLLLTLYFSDESTRHIQLNP